MKVKVEWDVFRCCVREPVFNIVVFSVNGVLCCVVVLRPAGLFLHWRVGGRGSEAHERTNFHTEPKHTGGRHPGMEQHPGTETYSHLTWRNI